MLFCKYWGPAFMKNREAIDIKPICIIMNGLAFGAYTNGILLGIVSSNFLQDCFFCSYSRNTTELAHFGIKYMAYLMIWTKVYDFCIPILSALAKKPEKITNLQLTHLFVALMMIWTFAKVNPGGDVILIGLIDTIYQVFVYGYLIMTAASEEMKPSKSFRTFLFAFREFSVILMLVHQLYFLPKNCIRIELRWFAIIYIALIGIFYPIDAYKRIEQQKQQQLDPNANVVDIKNKKLK